MLKRPVHSCYSATGGGWSRADAKPCGGIQDNAAPPIFSLPEATKNA
jgi:hypothetical protein